MRKGYIRDFKIPTIKTDEIIKEPYTEYELNLLLKKPNLKTCYFSEYRSWVLVNYFYSTGNRLETVLSLKIQDIDFSDGTAFLRTVKTRRQQIIPLSNTMLAILKEYLHYRKGTPEDYLFPTLSGAKLSKRAAQSSIASYNRKRGVSKTSIHLFRHAFARDWILNRRK